MQSRERIRQEIKRCKELKQLVKRLFVDETPDMIDAQVLSILYTLRWALGKRKSVGPVTSYTTFLCESMTDEEGSPVCILDFLKRLEEMDKNPGMLEN